MWMLVLAACAPGGVDLQTPGDSGDSEPPVPTAPTVTLSAPPAFDPIGGTPVSLAWAVDEPDAAVHLEVLDATGGTVLTADPVDATPVVWDGRLGDGTWAAPGRYTVRVTGTDAEDVSLVSTAESTLALVRAGFDAAWAEDDGGVTATRVPLWWHLAKARQDPSQPFSALAALEDEGGAALPLPAVGTDLARPTAGAADPLAYPYDSRPILTLEVGEATVLGATGLDAVDLGLSVPGWTVIAGLPLRPGTPVVLQKDAALAAGPGVVEGDLALTITAAGDDGTVWTVATQALPWRVYALLAAPTWDETGDRYTAWVAAVDPALRALDGVAAEPGAVLDALVAWVYESSGLAYDTQSGASAYVSYTDGWEGADIRFTAFLERKYGTIVNCTDCASILLAYANTLGARLSYTIILRNFSLNYILAIGGDTFTHCPFGPGGCGFSYHAVTTDDGGATIWDATLALDGDDDPGAAPNTELLVQSVDGEEYLDRLVMSGDAFYQYEDQGYLE